jgi:hypothetical protein
MVKNGLFDNICRTKKWLEFWQDFRNKKLKCFGFFMIGHNVFLQAYTFF